MINQNFFFFASNSTTSLSERINLWLITVQNCLVKPIAIALILVPAKFIDSLIILETFNLHLVLILCKGTSFWLFDLMVCFLLHSQADGFFFAKTYRQVSRWDFHRIVPFSVYNIASLTSIAPTNQIVIKKRRRQFGSGRTRIRKRLGKTQSRIFQKSPHKKTEYAPQFSPPATYMHLLPESIKKRELPQRVGIEVLKLGPPPNRCLNVILNDFLSCSVYIHGGIYCSVWPRFSACRGMIYLMAIGEIWKKSRLVPP